METESHERLIAARGAGSAPAVEHNTWQAHHSARARAEEHRALLARGSQLERGPIDDHGPGEIACGHIPYAPAYDILNWIGEILRVQAPHDVAKLTRKKKPANGARGRRRREEDLWLLLERKRRRRARHRGYYVENIGVTAG